jgi:hypothetical protein
VSSNVKYAKDYAATRHGIYAEEGTATATSSGVESGAKWVELNGSGRVLLCKSDAMPDQFLVSFAFKRTISSTTLLDNYIAERLFTQYDDQGFSRVAVGLDGGKVTLLVRNAVSGYVTYQHPLTLTAGTVHFLTLAVDTDTITVKLAERIILSAPFGTDNMNAVGSMRAVAGADNNYRGFTGAIDEVSIHTSFDTRFAEYYHFIGKEIPSAYAYYARYTTEAAYSSPGVNLSGVTFTGDTGDVDEYQTVRMPTNIKAATTTSIEYVVQEVSPFLYIGVCKSSFAIDTLTIPTGKEYTVSIRLSDMTVFRKAATLSAVTTSGGGQAVAVGDVIRLDVNTSTREITISRNDTLVVSVPHPQATGNLFHFLSASDGGSVDVNSGATWFYHDADDLTPSYQVVFSPAESEVAYYRRAAVICLFRDAASAPDLYDQRTGDVVGLYDGTYTHEGNFSPYADDRSVRLDGGTVLVDPAVEADHTKYTGSRSWHLAVVPEVEDLFSTKKVLFAKSGSDGWELVLESDGTSYGGVISLFKNGSGTPLFTTLGIGSGDESVQVGSPVCIGVSVTATEVELYVDGTLVLSEPKGADGTGSQDMYIGSDDTGLDNLTGVFGYFFSSKYAAGEWRYRRIDDEVGGLPLMGLGDPLYPLSLEEITQNLYDFVNVVLPVQAPFGDDPWIPNT